MCRDAQLEITLFEARLFFATLLLMRLYSIHVSGDGVAKKSGLYIRC